RLYVDVLELHDHGPARVHLETDQAGAGDHGAILVVGHGRDAVESQADVVPLGVDRVLVPAVLVHRLERGGRGRHQDPIAPGFVVEAAPVALADVGLEPDISWFGTRTLRNWT